LAGRKQFKEINMADFANLVLSVDTSGLKRGERDLKQFGAQGERTGRDVEKFSGSAKRSLGVVALAATAALGAFVSLGSAVRIIANFETSMSRLGAVSRATAGELEALRDIAKDLGSTTEFSASQAADGLNFLAMAGFNASEAMAAIPSVLDLATASGLGLAEAADTASNIMSGFGIAAADAAEVADVLAAASTRANTTVSQLGAAMSTVAPIASALDMSLEDTAAAIGVLSDAGIQGERAGTGLRGVLASLAGPTTQAEAVLRGLGLTIADVDPATNELSVVMARLGAAGLSTADAMTIFGREAASGALVLIEGAQRVGEFGDELEQATGAAGEMSSLIRDNLGGDLKGAASAAQGLAIALGDAGLTAAIRAVVQGITAMVRGFSAAVDFIGDFRGFVIAAALTLTAVYTPAIIAATVATASWVAALVTLRGALVATGFGALIVGAGILINQLLLLVEKTGGFGIALGLLKEVALGVWDKIKAGGEVLYLGLALTFNNIQDAWIQTIGALQLSWGRFVDSVAGSQVGGMMGIQGGNEDAASLILTDQVRASTDAFMDLTVRMDAAQARINGTTAGMDELRAAMADANQETSNGVGEMAALAAELEGVTDAIGGNGGASGAVTQLGKDLDDATDSATSFANTFKDGITDALDYVMSGMKNGMAGLLDIFKNTLMSMIKYALMNPINLQGGMNIAGGGGGGMLSSIIGGGGASGGGLLSTIGAGGGLAGSFMAGGAGLLTSLTGAGGGLASAGTYLSAVVGGVSSIGTAAAALGAVALPLALVAGVFSFFSSKTTLIDSGIRATIDMENAMFESFKTIEKSKFWGLSKKTSTSFSELTGEDATPFGEAVFAVRESVIGATESLGVSSDVFDGFTHDFTLSLKGLDEAARTAAITEEFARMGDSMAGLVPNIASMNELFAVAANRVSLTDRLLQAQGKTEELTARIRGREMDATNELNKSLLAQVFAAEDAAAAVAKLTASFTENAFATGIDFRRGQSRLSNGIGTTPQQSQAEMLTELKALNARIDVLQSTSEITANSSAQTAENTDYSNALTLDAAT
jgi:TP901 family phage tail tape measure protein